DRCQVRGRGRGVWAEASRPVHLEMTDTLTAIYGPVLLAEAGGKASGGTGTARFNRVTALVGGPLVEMHGPEAADLTRPAGLTKFDVEADDCLFADVPGAGRPLLELVRVDPTDWKAVVSWQVKKGNWYANFDDRSPARIQPPSEGAVKEWGWDDWAANAGEPAGASRRTGKVTFAAPPADPKDLAAVKPADLAIKGTSPVTPEGGVKPARLDELPLSPE
ncbi:MAG: hypothetical protein K2V38_16935, partial [Gemmataceae bacterium]|nr:hypothetical protein [Gemmataceae bacterium]